MTEHTRSNARPRADMVRDAFESAVRQLGPRVAGRERSLTLSADACHDQRWLVGFDKHGLDPAALLGLIASLSPPGAVCSAIVESWSKANFAYFAIEQGAPAQIKVYLEFPVLLSTRCATGVMWAEAALWCRGFKWRMGESGHRITDYRMVPGATLASIDDHLPALTRTPLFASVLHRLGVALAATQLDRPGAIDLLLLDTEPHGKGMDLRVYDIGLSVGDLRDPLLQSSGSAIGVAARGALARALDAHAAHPLGHVSMGWRSLGEPYLNLYWEEPRMSTPGTDSR